MLPLLRRIRHLGQAHLGYGHLRDIDEYFQIATVASNGSGSNCGLQILRGYAHAEKYALATHHGTCDNPGTREVADQDFRADRSERIGTLILASDKRADRHVAFAKNLDNRATNST